MQKAAVKPFLGKATPLGGEFCRAGGRHGALTAEGGEWGNVPETLH